MDRHQFLKKAALGATAIISAVAAFAGCGSGNGPGSANDGPCGLSPDETKGPFPNKASEDFVQTNIVADRKGVALAITMTVLSQKNNCQPLPGVFVDVWHCDAHGAYSEYGGMRMQEADHRHEHFLRGRQVTDQDGKVTFESIYSGWYPGRAPHIHVEVLDKNERSLAVTQIAFPEDVNTAVYATENYRGDANMSNERDGIFRDSLAKNMADSMAGSVEAGYSLQKNIVV